MKYILIGLCVSIGWHIGILIHHAVDEMIYRRLNKAKWYKILVGRESIKPKNKPDNKKKIGFE